MATLGEQLDATKIDQKSARFIFERQSNKATKQNKPSKKAFFNKYKPSAYYRNFTVELDIGCEGLDGATNVSCQ